MLSVALAAVAGTAAALAHGACHRNSPIFGQVISRLPDTDRAVALTFDDGPSPDATPRILDILGEARVSATFFLLGKHVERWPALARRIADEGHAIGNHGYHHGKLHLRGPAYARLDLRLGTDVIARATGQTPRHFRAPHGFRAPWVNAIARELGQRAVGWTLGVWDSDRPGVDVIADRVRRGARPGCIVLLHDGDAYDPVGDRTQTAEALRHIIRNLSADGYRFAALPG